MKKLLFVVGLIIASLFPIAEAAQKGAISDYHSSSSVNSSSKGFPTDITVYNYSYGPVTVTTPEDPWFDARLSPYPYVPYSYHFWHTSYAMWVRVIIYDQVGYPIFDRRVEPQSIIKVTPPMAKDGKPMVNVSK